MKVSSARVLALAAMVAGALITLGPSAQASTSDFNGVRLWSRTPAATLMMRHFCGNQEDVPAVQNSVSTQIAPDHLPHVGESFYVQLEMMSVVPDACEAPLVTPYVNLPGGMRLATDRPLRCFAILPPHTGWAESFNTCGTAEEQIGRYKLTGAFSLSQGTTWRIWLPVVASRQQDFTPQLSFDVTGTQYDVSNWTRVTGGSYIPRSPDAMVSYWESHGGPGSPLGLPDSDIRAQYGLAGTAPHFRVVWTEDWHFESGQRITYNTDIGLHVVPAELANHWYPEIGVATSDARWVTNRSYQQDFQWGCWIAWDSVTHAVTIHDPYHGAGATDR